MDMVVDHAPVLSYGKELFQYRGCMGCHRFQNYDPEPEEVSGRAAAGFTAGNPTPRRGSAISSATSRWATGADNDTARMYYTLADKLRVSISDIDGRLEQLDRRSKDLLRDMKKGGTGLERSAREDPSRLGPGVDFRSSRLAARRGHTGFRLLKH